MSYCTQSDMEAIGGTSNVATWSNLENDSTSADAARITAAINYAGGIMDSRLSRQFAVPLTNVRGGSLDYAVIEVAAKLALAWLTGPRTAASEDSGERSVDWRAEAHSMMSAWLAGTIDPGLTRRATIEPRAPFGV